MTLHFPPPRAEIQAKLEAGDQALRRAMEGRTRVFEAGDFVLRGGEAHERVYRLRSGWLARTRSLRDSRRQIIMIFLPGDLVAVKAMLFERQPDSIQALTAASADFLGAAEAVALASQDGDIGWRFTWQLAEDERRLHNYLVALGCGDAIERMAMLMLDLRRRLQLAGFDAETEIRVPLTQQQIGDHLGLTVVHVNRVLRRLREEGVLEMRRGVVKIGDTEALARYAAPAQDFFERASPDFKPRFAGSALIGA